MYDEEVEEQVLKAEADRTEQVLALNPSFFELLTWRSDKEGAEDWGHGRHGPCSDQRKRLHFFLKYSLSVHGCNEWHGCGAE